MKSDEVDYGDCRHDCEDEESHQEDVVEGDQVHDGHDDRSACILVRARAFDILVVELALHERSTIVLLRGIQVISYSFEFLVILPISHSVRLLWVSFNAKS